MKIEDLVGTYAIIGSNQNASETNYKGTLTLKLDTNNRLLAHWLIDYNQEQVGSGFFKDTILVINFSYLGEDKNNYYGVVVYRCLSNDLLDGFWSEEYGDPLHLGSERCFRIKDTHELLN